MSDSQGGPGRREVAFRLFAAEYDDADLSYSESDEERAPNYVVTPSGARVNRLFVVGVLTEVENVSEDYLRARVVDPTGPFVIYAGQYQPEAMNFLERAEPPLFVAVTGKARTFQPEDSDLVYTSIRPESINEVDAETRDRWVVQAAEQTVERITRTAEAKRTGLAGETLATALHRHGVEESPASGIPLALDHYGTTGEYLAALKELALDSARVVAGERDEVAGLSLVPGDGTDDPLADLAERQIDVERIETEDSESVDLSTAPEPDDEPSPTDEEIDEAVESTNLDGETDAEGVETTDAADAETGSAPAETDDSVVEETPETTSAAASDETESAAEENTAAEETTGATATEGGSDAGEPEPDAGDTEDAGGAGDAGAAEDEEGEETDDDLEEFDGEFELDDEERAEIEEEYGTEFQSGSEVEEPGEADIETPETEPPAEPGEADVLDEEVEEVSEDDEDEDESPEETSSDEERDGDDGDEDERGEVEGGEVESSDDVALDDAVMDAMADLDDGDGADRDAVVAEVVESTGADPGDVEEAIQEALMDGRCYEPDDETLKAI